MTLYERLKAKWLEGGIPLNGGINKTDIDYFERDTGVRLPRDFREYLLLIDGMKEGHADENLVSFLPFNAMKRETNLEDIETDEVDIVFADFSVYSHCYVLRIKRTGEEIAVLASDGERERVIARSFADFVSEYLRNSNRVAYCWPG